MNILRLPAAALLLGLLPDTAAACSCGFIPTPYAERRLSSPVVFHGKVTATEVDEAGGGRWIRFAVIKDYGVDGSIVADTATVWTHSQSSACGVYFPVGEEVLVFAGNQIRITEPPRPAAELTTTLVTSLCNRNISGAELPEALRGMDEALGVRTRGPRTAAGAHGTVFDCGQILFEGRVRADGVLRSAPGNR